MTNPIHPCCFRRSICDVHAAGFRGSRLARLDWGSCGRGHQGQWLNLPNRYLGLKLRVKGSSMVYYGWAEVVETAFVDHHGHRQTFVMLQGFAYETVPGRAILAGQTSER